MTVYVDDAKQPFGRMLMCHMLADTPDELHRFAESIGIRKDWFHRGHYNISLTKRRLAVSLGAQEITKREAARMRRALGVRL